MSEQQANPNQTIIDLSNYAKQREAGIIYFTSRDGKVILVQKVFNNAHEEISTREKPFSSFDIAQFQLQRDAAKLQLRGQIIDLERQIADMETDDKNLNAMLLADVKTAEKEALASTAKR
jgi:hypothetical protein